VSFAGGVAVTKFFHALYIGEYSLNFRERHVYTGSGFRGSGVSAAAGLKSGRSNRKRNFEVSYRDLEINQADLDFKIGLIC